MPPLSPEIVEPAIQYLRRRDKILAALISAVGPFALKRQTNRYQALLRAIVSQQISTAAARAIWARLETAANTRSITVEHVHNLSDESLRAVGLSAQKIRYVRDLTERVHNRELRLASLHRLSDEDVIAALTEVKGIGVWTAQMFLMFSLGRLDVLPHADLGIQAAMRNLYQLPANPGRDECHRIAQPWRPYATIACWYLWRSIDVPVAETTVAELWE